MPEHEIAVDVVTSGRSDTAPTPEPPPPPDETTLVARRMATFNIVITTLQKLAPRERERVLRAVTVFFDLE